jgi:hypothetical protein
MAGFGQKQSLTGTTPNVCFSIRNPTLQSIAAAQNELFLSCVGFAI